MSMQLFTKRGDTGTTTRFGSKQRLRKDAPLFEVLGALDELGAYLGLAKVWVPYDPLVHEPLHALQEALFVVQAEVAGAPKHLTLSALTRLESMIGAVEVQLENPHGFVLSGATRDAAFLDVVRTVARRAERALVHARLRRVRPTSYAYLNRASSALYALARYVAQGARVPETHPSYLETI